MHLPADAVTIQFVDVGEYIYHPVSEAEVRELLGRLPHGCLAGVSAIRFELGKEHQEDWFRKHARRDGLDSLPLVRDPWHDRLSVARQTRHGEVFRPPLLGLYDLRSNCIRIFAYACSPDSLDEEEKRECKHNVFSTLLHELAHHDDKVRRVARGRWTLWNVRRAEDYADATAEQWMREFVLPMHEDPAS